MPKLNILGGSGAGRSLNVNASRSVNLFPELDADPESKAVISLVKTSGCSLWSALGAGPNRGQHVFNGLNYVVSGSGLYAVAANGTVTGPLGNLLTVTNRVQMRDNGLLSNGVGGDQLMIVDGQAGYIWDVGANTFTVIASSGFPTGPTHVEYIDGYFIATNNTMNASASELYDGTTWNPLAATPVQSASDNIAAPAAYSEQLIFIKQYTTEFYANNGVPTINGFPFSRISGAVVPWGTDAPWSICQGAGSLFWLATERKENGGEFIGPGMLTGAAPTLVGTPAIIAQMDQWKDRANAFTFCFSERGHTFFQVTSPGDNQTLVYDTTTQMWHDRSSYTDNPYAINRHLANSYTYFSGMRLIGDYQSGNIFQMDQSRLTDRGLPIVWLRRTNHLFDDDMLSRLFVSHLELDVDIEVQPGVAAATATLAGSSVGSVAIINAGYDYLTSPQVLFIPIDGNGAGAAATCGAGRGSIQSVTVTAGGAGYTQPPTVVFVDQVITPTIALSYSKDKGHTYGNERVKPVSSRISFWQLGANRDKVWQIRGSDPTSVVLLGGHAEVEG
jgi:hypothetical protein